MANSSSDENAVIPGLLAVTDGGPDDALERLFHSKGIIHVAGVDEAGRGPLAGPVVAASIIFAQRPDASTIADLEGIDDSKKLNARKRNELYGTILRHAVSVSVCAVCPASIDASDIRKASLEAMRRSVLGLCVTPGAALFDGRDIPPGLPQDLQGKALIKGDAISISIAAASIVAKVSRDRMMEKLGHAHPLFGLEKHMGYGSASHRQAISESGGVPRVHRFSFRPLKT